MEVNDQSKLINQSINNQLIRIFWGVCVTTKWYEEEISLDRLKSQHTDTRGGSFEQTSFNNLEYKLLIYKSQLQWKPEVEEPIIIYIILWLLLKCLG